MRANSPPEHCHVLDLSGLQTPDVKVWSAWRDELIVGVGALRKLDAETGEVKSMRVHPLHLRGGVGAALLERIISEAAACNLRRLSLETGTGPMFEPAIALYRRRGFAFGPPFGDYRESDFNVYLHLEF